MPENGTYLLTSVGFSSNEEPFLLLQKDDTFISFKPIGNSLTLSFDMSERYCTGWKDITTGERFTCPTQQIVAPKYEQCPACQKRTGFNPAFYHATTVSAQQETRNTEPHILYLAHFGLGIVKVGISHAKRGHARLLEQGARSAIILDTLPSAHIARQYEAKIAALPTIVETIQLRKKIEAMTRHYDSQAAKRELEDMKSTIESQLGVAFNAQPMRQFDSYYFPTHSIDLSESHPMVSQHLIAGEAIGQMGAILFCEQAEESFYLPMKQHVGYRVSLSNTVTQITTPARQTSLF